MLPRGRTRRVFPTPNTTRGSIRLRRARRKRKKKQLSRIKSEAALTVELIDLAGRDAPGADAVIGEFFAAGVDVYAARVLNVRINVHDVNVENERLLAGGREPMDVVLVIGHR